MHTYGRKNSLLACLMSVRWTSIQTISILAISHVGCYSGIIHSQNIFSCLQEEMWMSDTWNLDNETDSIRHPEGCNFMQNILLNKRKEDVMEKNDKIIINKTSTARDIFFLFIYPYNCVNYRIIIIGGYWEPWMHASVVYMWLCVLCISVVTGLENFWKFLWLTTHI